MKMKQFPIASLILLVMVPRLAVAQGRNVRDRTPEQASRSAAVASLFHDGEVARLKARTLWDSHSPNAEAEFLKASDIFASIPDRSEASKTEAEIRFLEKDYTAVVKLLKNVRSIQSDPDTVLWLAISKCHLGEGAAARPLLRNWLDQEYCESGSNLTADLPAAADVGPRATEATAWVILSFRQQQMGRPALNGFLEAQRLSPQNPTVAYHVAEAAILRGQYDLALKNLPTVRNSKNRLLRACVPGIQASIIRQRSTIKPNS